MLWQISCACGRVLGTCHSKAAASVLFQIHPDGYRLTATSAEGRRHVRQWVWSVDSVMDLCSDSWVIENISPSTYSTHVQKAFKCFTEWENAQAMLIASLSPSGISKMSDQAGCPSSEKVKQWPGRGSNYLLNHINAERQITFPRRSVSLQRRLQQSEK